MKDHALNVFRRPPERLNCAQAVLDAYTKISGREVMPVADLKGFGGGRAPEGLCGAIYAACVIAPEQAEALKSKFAQRQGSATCKELRANPEHRCEVSVAVAAELVQMGMMGK